MKIALAGNPNSGKTTLYNAITGKHEHTGNWAGVTVEKIESVVQKKYSDGKRLVAVDLPGAYSMSPYTAEESITKSYVCKENPNVIINIVDATNLSRSLFFSTQLQELGIPMVVALNKNDINKKTKTKIDTELLSAKLNCPVVDTVATKGKGLKELLQKAMEVASSGNAVDGSFEQSDSASKEEVQAQDKERFEFVREIVETVEQRQVKSSAENKQDKIDKVIANKWLGLPIFAVVMWGVFYISQSTVGTWIAEFLGGLISTFQEWAGGMLQGASPFLSSLLVDGIIGGVGAVVGFLPLIMVMFFLLALLEDCGYMARVAVVMDRYLKVFGLSGKSIIPMVLGTGCSIPGIMASRTIKNERERNATAMLTPFMPCGAKLPVIALFSTAFFADATWIGTLMYFVGIIFICLGSFVIMRICGQKNHRSFFMMELPNYKVPSLKLATRSMLERGKAFIIKAGTIILLCNALVQTMQSFTWTLQPVVEGGEHLSILAGIATPFAWLLIPLGFGVWQLAAAAITGFVAKENVVGTLAVVYGITQFIDTESLEIVSGSTEIATVMGITKVVALAYLMFNLFTPPCFAAIGAMNAELSSKKWLFGGIALQFGTGYTVAFAIYQIGMLVSVGTVGDGFIWGLIAVVAMISAVIYLMIKGDRKAEMAKNNCK